jgi:hypothetical protein
VRYSLPYFVFVALMTAVVLSGCQSRKATDDYDEDYYRASVQKQSVQAAVAETLKAVKGPYTGTIQGKVVWKGDKPNFVALDEELMKQVKGNPDAKYCELGKDYEKNQQTFRLGSNGNLGNVVVWISPEAGSTFDVPDEQIASLEKKLKISQPHCAFLPHVSVTFPSRYKNGKQEPTGQVLAIENDATVAHNANVQGGPLNGQRNQTLPPKGANVAELTLTLKPEKSAINLSCSIHSWMRAYIWAFDHPYAAVSRVGGNGGKPKWEDLDATDFGTFEIKGVPVGAKVKVNVWHEKATVTGPKEITIGEGVTTIDFEAK